MSPVFLTRSAERTVAAHRLTQLAPGVDSLLLADLLDQTCAELLRVAGLTDDQAREVMALLWARPQVTEHYVAITTRGTATVVFNGQRIVRQKLHGRLSYGWECIVCFQAGPALRDEGRSVPGRRTACE